MSIGYALLYSLLSTAASVKEAGWNDKNIVLDGTPPKWVQITDPPISAPQPLPPYDDKWKRHDSSIIVMAASYRESRCPEMVHSFFSQATYPDRVFLAIIQQNAPTDVDCVEGYCKLINKPLTKTGVGVYENNNNCDRYDQIRIKRMDSKEAQGPVFARAKQVELLEETDDFCMQIDAHTKVLKNWDVMLTKDWGNAFNEYAVLTTYPTNAKDILDGVMKNTNNHWEMPHLCGASFVGPGRVRNAQASAAANLDHPILTPLWAAGLSFMRCHAERNLPNDPELKGIFMGEEYARAARLWTNGYDFYTPTRPWVGTFYADEKGNKEDWDHASSSQSKIAEERLKTLLKWPGSDQSASAVQKLGHKYGLGSRRTIEQYNLFSGVDTETQKITKKCVAKWIPWNKPYKVLEGTPDAAYAECSKAGGATKIVKVPVPVTVTVPVPGAASMAASGNDGAAGLQVAGDDDDRSNAVLLGMGILVLLMIIYDCCFNQRKKNKYSV